jgi:hypothetical protein
MREHANLTLEAAAPRLDKTRSSLARVETGKSRADVHLIRSMMDLYDHYDPDLLDLAREAMKPTWWTPFFRRSAENRGYVGLEADAVAVREFSLAYVPGLLQTEQYMRAVFASELVPRDAEQVENEVTVRLRRQHRLTDDEFPLHLVAIVDESALRRPVGGPDVMREQLGQLAERVRLPNVSVQIVPNEIGTHVGMEGPFVILDYEEAEPSLLYVNHLIGALHLDEPAELTRARALFEVLRSRALSQEDSLLLVEKIMSEY